MDQRTVGGHRLERALGRGGAGSVWQALRPDGQRVALKLVEGRGHDALAAEVRAIAALDHPHVVPLYDFGPWTAPDGREGAWLAMELATDDLVRDPPCDGTELVDVLAQVLHGLAHAHAHGIVHRDLKPDNLLRCRGRVAIADFGLAAAFDATGPRAGTPAYMAPELLDRRHVGPWTDLYALGCIAWQFLTGHPPFARPTLRETLRAQRMDSLPPSDLPGVDPGFRAWIERLVAKDPRARYRVAADALHDLEGLAGPRGVPEGVPSPSAMSTWMVLDDDPGTITVELEPLHRTTTDFVDDWRLPWDDVLPLPRHGAAVAAFGLRTPPLLGHEAHLDTLWAELGRVHREGGLVTMGLGGAPGTGRRDLGRAFARRATERGVAYAVDLSVGPADGLRRAVGRSARAAAIAWGHPHDDDELERLDPAQDAEALRLFALAAEGADRPVVVLAATPPPPDLVAGPAGLLWLHPGATGSGPVLAPLSDEALRRRLDQQVALTPSALDHVLAAARGLPQEARRVLTAELASGHLVPHPDGHVHLAEAVPDPTDPHQVLACARDYSDRGRMPAAHWWLEQVPEAHTSEVLRLRVTVAINTDSDPRPHVARLTAADPTPSDWIWAARGLRRADRWREALAQLDRVVTDEPVAIGQAQGLRAECLAVLGRFDEALLAGDVAVASFAGRPAHQVAFRRVQRSEALRVLRRFDEAEHELALAEAGFASIDNTHGIRNVRYQRARIAVMQGAIDEADRLQQAVLELTLRLGGTPDDILEMYLAIQAARGSWARVARTAARLLEEKAPWSMDPNARIMGLLAAERLGTPPVEPVAATQQAVDASGYDPRFFEGLMGPGTWPRSLTRPHPTG